jgi:hypothetical protein
LFDGFSTTFNNISVIYRSGQFYWWREPEKTTDLTKPLTLIRDQRDSAMVMKMNEFVHDHGPR